MDDLGKCKDSIAQIKNTVPNAIFKASEDSSNWPKGCYLYTTSNAVYFNEHATGSSNSRARHICEVLSKLLI